jgi:glycosyltransferase involved in cell wall biosynthesis
MKILVYPKDDNPYQELLYEELREKKNIFFTYLETEFLNSHTLSLILLPYRLIIYRLKHFKIFHLHWIYPFGFANNNKLFQNFLTRAFFSIYFMLFLKLVILLDFKLVWTVHEVIPIENEPINGVWARRFLSKLCDAKIVHAKSSIEKMQKLGINTSNTHIVSHGNYFSVYENNITRDSARKYLGFNIKDFVFLFFGGIKPYKGVDDLLEAFKQLIKERKNVRLLIAGKCNSKDLKKMLNNYKKELKEDVKIYTEYIENDKVQYYFNCADAVVYPFKKITTSGSIILALSFGKPVIYPRIGNLKELPCNLGFFYKAGSEKALLDCMEKAILNKGKLKKMEKNSFDYANSISWDKIAEKTYEIYKNLENKNH